MNISPRPAARRPHQLTQREEEKLESAFHVLCAAEEAADPEIAKRRAAFRKIHFGPRHPRTA